MEVDRKDAENWTPKSKRAGNIRNAENQPGSVGGFSISSKGTRDDEIRISGENSQSRDISFSGEQLDVGSPGKIASQLVEKIETELAYHESQAEFLRGKLEDLKQFIEHASSTDEHE